MKKKAISLLLILTMLLTSLASCADDTSDDKGTPETSSNGDVSVEETTSAETEYQLPAVNFDGDDFNFFLWDAATIAIEDETGDALNDALYRRNRKIQEDYGVKFNFTVSPGGVNDYATWLNTVNGSILGDDGSMDLIGGYAYRFAQATLDKNSFHNLKEINNIDFDREWWISSIAEACDIGGKLYMTLGNISHDFYNGNAAMFFNKTIATDIGIPDLYALVESGGWTIEKFEEYAKLGDEDLDGNGTMEIGDQWGYATNRDVEMDAYIQAFDVEITEKDSNGLPQLVGLTEKYISVQERLDSLLHSEWTIYSDNTGGAFKNGLALFGSLNAGYALNIRDSDVDFGILPYPKWDDAQENYITYNAIGNSTGFAIPTTADAEMVGAVLEALAYYGYTDVRPEYYERALKGKGARDNESEAMLDIIFDNVRIEFTEFYSYNFGDCKAPSMLLRMTLKNNAEMASSWAADEKLYTKTMEKIIDSLN